jgi:hypothetical protein
MTASGSRNGFDSKSGRAGVTSITLNTAKNGVLNIQSVLPNSMGTVRKDHKGHKDSKNLTQRRKDAKRRRVWNKS